MSNLESLTPGGSGDEVTDLQQRLQHLGHYDGYVDGYFGEKTEAAVRAFQQAAGQAEDGVVSYDTWEVIERSSTDAGYGAGTGYDQSPDQSAAYGTEYQEQSYEQSAAYGTEYQTGYEQQYEQTTEADDAAAQQETEPRERVINDEIDGPETEAAVPASSA